MRWLSHVLCRFVVLVCLVPRPAASAPPTDDPPASVVGPGGDAGAADDEVDPAAPADTPSGTEDLGAQMLARAAAIDALRAGSLDPAIDERALLVMPTSWLDAGLDGPLARWLETRIAADPSVPHDGDATATATEDGAISAADTLIAAIARFAQQSPEDRAAQLETHAQRRAAAERAATVQALRRARGDEARARADELVALLDGTLDPDRRLPTELDLGLAALWLEDAGDIQDAMDPGETADAEDAEDAEDAATTVDPLSTATSDLLAAIHRYAALGIEARAALRENHAARLAAERRAAEEAVAAATAAHDREMAEARARKQEIETAKADAAKAEADQAAALEAARQARSETQRLIAEEAARLHGIEIEHAELEGALAEAEQSFEAEREANRARVASVRRLRGRADAFEPIGQEADALYAPIRDAVGTARVRLGEAMDELRAPDGVARPGGVPSTLETVDSPELDAQRELITVAAAALARRVATFRAARVDGLYADATALNLARLDLLQLASPELRATVTGFGPEGVRQVRREVQHILLETRYQAIDVPRRLEALRADFRTSPVPLALVVLQAFLAVAVFRWWRRVAPSALMTFRRRLVGDGLGRRWFRLGLWYLERVRQPLELLALALFVLRAVDSLDSLPGLDIARSVAIWLTVASAAVFAIDAMAQRQDAGSPEQAKVRLRSLRLIGLAIAWTGLLLSLTETLVGHGAIYTWVFRLCWFLAIPFAGLVFAWWRPIVVARLRETPSPTPVARWVIDHDRGMLRPVTAVVGGLYVFGRGAWQGVLRRAATTESTRRVLAYLFRREVERQAEQEALTRLAPISDVERHALLQPCATIDVHEAELADIMATARTHRETFTAVIGERGLGKSTLLDQLATRLGDSCIRVQCPREGYAGLLGELATALGIDDAAESQVVAALAARRPLTVLVDDLDRLVTPTLGGLDQLELFTHLPGAIDDGADWVATFDAAAWQFTRRARGERVFFDAIVKLPRWTEEQIGELLVRHAEQAGLTPAFDGLVLPRQLDEGIADEATRLRQGFFRIMWDGARGNPAVALEDWARALARDADEVLHVRLPPPRRERELDTADAGVKFILRALVQVGEATRERLEECTQMRPAEVTDALRFSVGRHYVVRDGTRFSVPMDHFRPVVEMLRRKNLLLVD